jgi:hypothetical protein
MQTFGNLNVRTQNEQRAQERAEWAAAGIQPRTCMKCSWQTHPDEQWCPKCGVVFAKAMARTSTPAPFVPDHAGFDPIAPETPDDAPYFFGEVRVMSMLASVGTLALVAGARTNSGVDLLDAAFVLQLLAVLMWIGARAYEWGVKNGAVGFIVLFFVTGWIWPLMAKPIAWLARVPASLLPRATGWIPAGVLLALSCAAAIVR